MRCACHRRSESNPIYQMGPKWVKNIQKMLPLYIRYTELGLIPGPIPEFATCACVWPTCEHRQVQACPRSALARLLTVRQKHMLNSRFRARNRGPILYTLYILRYFFICFLPIWGPFGILGWIRTGDDMPNAFFFDFRRFSRFLAFRSEVVIFGK